MYISDRSHIIDTMNTWHTHKQIIVCVWRERTIGRSSCIYLKKIQYDVKKQKGMKVQRKWCKPIKFKKFRDDDDDDNSNGRRVMLRI